MTAGDIKNIEAEAGVVASVLIRPELTFYSEQLKPNHFTNPQNAYVYYAVSELAKLGVEQADAYNITNFLNTKRGTQHVGENINGIVTVQSLQELFDNAKLIARETPEDYQVIVGAVLDAAFRRNTYLRLVDCERMCFSGTEDDIEHQIYTALDDVMMEFSTTTEVPQYKDVVRLLWEEIEARQNPETLGSIPFKFPTLNEYVTIERGELVIFGAEQKQGKSMMMLNIAVDLMRKGMKVLYLDSELNSRLFTCRIVSHLTGIDFRKVRAGGYNDDEKQRIYAAVSWLEKQSFTHLYMPIFDEQSIYTTIKKVYHTQGIDVLIIDYFKSDGNGDAYAVYQKMGGLIDTIKNRVAGALNIAAIGAAQATSTGKLADSAKIARNASTIIILQNKTPEEIERDGRECGNKKLIVKFNRNGDQMDDNTYIDMFFDGNKILYEEAKQHILETPY